MKLEYSLSQNISVSHNGGVILQKIMIEISWNYVRAHDLCEGKWLKEYKMSSRMLMKNGVNVFFYDIQKLRIVVRHDERQGAVFLYSSSDQTF